MFKYIELVDAGNEQCFIGFLVPRFIELEQIEFFIKLE